MTSDWDDFLAGLPWLIDNTGSVEVGRSSQPGPPPAIPPVLPALTRVLAAARTTQVRIDGERRHLLTWPSRIPGDRLHWLCPPPGGEPVQSLHPLHRELLRNFGGILERSGNEPLTWLMNCNDTLTLREAGHDATFLTDYAWMLGEGATGWPIDVRAFYAISREFNGNTTLCHRVTGDVVLFAPDHDFSDVDIVEGCPPYSLYRRHGAYTLAQWIEQIARQWLAECDPGSG